MDKKTVKQFIKKHDINYREIGNKIVLIYSDGLAEEYLFFDASGCFNGNLHSVLSSFLTINQKRQRIINAFNIRAKELGASVSGRSVETASGIGSYAALDDHLNSKLATTDEADILRELLKNTFLEICPADITISRLLKGKARATPLSTQAKVAEPSLQNALQDLLKQSQNSVEHLHKSGKIPDELKQDIENEIQKALTDIDDLDTDLSACFDSTYSEVKHSEQEQFEELFEQFCKTLPLHTLVTKDFPASRYYADFDHWALDKIKAFRQAPVFSDIEEYSKFHPSDWYVSIDDLISAVDKELAKDPCYWGSYGYLKLQYNRITAAERQQALARAKFLAGTGCDFDCYYELMSFFIKDIPDLAEAFEDSGDYKGYVYGWRGGVMRAEYNLRRFVLYDDEEEMEKDNGYFDIDYFPKLLTTEEIQQLFTEEELAMLHRISLRAVTNLDDEDSFKLHHENSMILALKMGWNDVLDAIKKNTFLPHLLWQTTRNKAEIFSCFDEINDSFNAYLDRIKHSKKEKFSKKAARELRSAKTLFFWQGLDDNQLLLWTLAPQYHNFIRPYFAYMIDRKMKNPNDKLVMNDDMALAIGWSRLRRETMQAADNSTKENR